VPRRATHYLTRPNRLRRGAEGRQIVRLARSDSYSLLESVGTLRRCSMFDEPQFRCFARPFRCASSQLDPRELVDGFDGLGADLQAMGTATSASFSEAPRQRTANRRCAAVGIDRTAPSNRRARTQPNSSPVLSPLGSAVLDFVLALVAAMARQPDHRPARDSLALAP